MQPAHWNGMPLVLECGLTDDDQKQAAKHKMVLLPQLKVPHCDPK